MTVRRIVILDKLGAEPEEITEGIGRVINSAIPGLFGVLRANRVTVEADIAAEETEYERFMHR